MTRYLRMFRQFVRSELQFEMAYRANLAAELFQMLIVIVTSLAAVLVLFSYTTSLNGWSLAEMVVLLGVYYIVQGVEEVVISPSMQKLIEQVRLGTLDFTLLKPANTRFLVSVRHLKVVLVAEVLTGVGVLGVGLSLLGRQVSAWQAFQFVVALACGVLLIYLLLLALATTAFWWVRVENIFALYWAFVDAARFPVDIYPGWLRLTMSSVIPVGLAVTVPAQAIASRLDTAGLLLLVAATAAAWLFVSWFWRVGLRGYTGASA